MRFLRCSFFFSSSAAWAAALFVVAAAITFTPMVTFAETGPLLCSSEPPADCIDAAAGQACACADGDCACGTAPCQRDGKAVEQRVCTPIATCKSGSWFGIEQCEGKAKGERCEPAMEGSKSGTCAPIDCAESNDAGIYEKVEKLGCSAAFGDGEIPGSNRGTPSATGGAPTTTPTNIDGGSGCNAAPGMGEASELMAGAPLALLALAALRRRAVSGKRGQSGTDRLLTRT